MAGHEVREVVRQRAELRARLPVQFVRRDVRLERGDFLAGPRPAGLIRPAVAGPAATPVVTAEGTRRAAVATVGPGLVTISAEGTATAVAAGLAPRPVTGTGRTPTERPGPFLTVTAGTSVVTVAEGPARPIRRRTVRPVAEGGVPVTVTVTAARVLPVGVGTPGPVLAASGVAVAERTARPISSPESSIRAPVPASVAVGTPGAVRALVAPATPVVTAVTALLVRTPRRATAGPVTIVTLVPRRVGAAFPALPALAIVAIVAAVAAVALAEAVTSAEAAALALGPVSVPSAFPAIGAALAVRPAAAIIGPGRAAAALVAVAGALAPAEVVAVRIGATRPVGPGGVPVLVGAIPPSLEAAGSARPVAAAVEVPPPVAVAVPAAIVGTAARTIRGAEGTATAVIPVAVAAAPFTISVGADRPVIAIA
ncbi:hypothetical protein AAH991_27925 [Microbispora sp. ZYX-F-249]|uniref:Uncharacterized protein n=1 Tax=Microbispora maris TaxID=3144104 RepID=A0ABV0AWK6_9ACTN